MSDAHHKPRNKQGKPASDDPVLLALGERARVGLREDADPAARPSR